MNDDFLIREYRKKPVVIEAVELTQTNIAQVCRWSHAEPLAYKNEHNPTNKRGLAGIRIKTLEGNMIGDFGDYIIKGVQGEFYPCKPDIFTATYEPEATHDQ
jgi:hypothetical protein